MKKVLAFILAACLLVAAVPVLTYATSSPQDNPPEKIMTMCTDCNIITWSNRGVLDDAKRAVFEEGKEVLEDAVPDGFACRDYVYQDVKDDCSECAVAMLMVGSDEVDEEAEIQWIRDNTELEICSAYRVTMSMDGVSEVAVKQYLGGEWVDKDVIVGENSVVIEAVVDGPVAIFTK